MIQRAFAVFIVLFWCVMTALLVRLEVRPDKSRVLEVPVAHVVKLIFERGQQSLLNVKENGRDAGVVSFRPTSPDADTRLLEFNGSLSLRLPMAGIQRVSWNGALDMDRRWNTHDFHLEFVLREPPYRVAITALIPKRQLFYETWQAGQRLGQGTVALDESSATAMLRQVGISPDLVANLRKNLGAPVVSAKQAELRVRGERIEVFQLNIRQEAATVADIFISQLGQVLLVNTTFGYTLAADGL